MVGHKSMIPKLSRDDGTNLSSNTYVTTELIRDTQATAAVLDIHVDKRRGRPRERTTTRLQRK